MLKDYEKREHEIDIIDHIIAAARDKDIKYFDDNWEEKQHIIQWLYNQRHGDMLESIRTEDVTISEREIMLIIYIITDSCDESIFYETMKWFVNHVVLEGEE